MTGRHWFRRDVLIPLLILIGFGAGLGWLWQQIRQHNDLVESRTFIYLFLFCLAIYVLLVVVTVRHAFSSYSLERFNPGNPQSIRRLQRFHRFHLPRNLLPILQNWVEPVEDIGSWLKQTGYTETAHTTHGIVYQHLRLLPSLTFKRNYDRIFVLRKDMLNVLIVDQLIKDCIRYILGQSAQPSKRNLFILVTNMTDADETASAAAGAVNFLGKFTGGSMGVLLLNLHHGWLFHAIDRSLQPRGHRIWQDRIKHSLLHNLRRMKAGVRPRVTVESDRADQNDTQAWRPVRLDNEDAQADRMDPAADITQQTQPLVIQAKHPAASDRDNPVPAQVTGQAVMVDKNADFAKSVHHDKPENTANPDKSDSTEYPDNTESSASSDNSANPDTKLPV